MKIKTISSTAVVCISLAACLPPAMLSPLAQGQSIDQSMLTNTPPPVPLANRTQQALARDTISTTWEVLDQTFYPDTGAVTSCTHQYVELGAGLNYLSDPTAGQWAPSEDLIQLMPDGSAAALKGPTKLYLKPNLNSPGALKIVSADGAVFQTHPIGLFWYDPVSGKASLIARAQDCAGELDPPNQVVYRGAFGEVGDLRVTYTKGAIESDLVLVQCPQLPPGLDPATARLELWHACQSTATPKITPHAVGAKRATDDVLEIGDLWFPTGAAYWSDGSVVRAADSPATVRVPRLTDGGTLAPVCKTWLAGATEDVLVEALVWNVVAAKLASLPPTAPAYLPTPAQDRGSWLAELDTTPGPGSPSLAMISQGRSYRSVGLVWDYITVTGSGSYTFNTGQTYYVSSGACFSGNLTFNPCVIKFNSGTYLLTYGSITCNGSSSTPTIFTSYQDDLFGQQVQTNSPCPSQAASDALWAYYINANVSLSGLRFRWANIALDLDSDPQHPNATSVSGCSFEFCGVGISASHSSVTLSTSTRCSVSTPTQAWTGASFTGSLTDMCSGDSDGNGVSDLTEYQYFGRLGTLPGHLLSQMNTFTNGHSPGWDQMIYTGDLGTEDANNQYYYRQAFFLLGARGVPDQSVGISAMSWWHSGANCHQSAGTLITPRHAITVGHMVPPNGTVFRFVGKNNDSHSVTLLQSEGLPDVGGYFGYWVLLFDQDLPTNTIAYVRVLPDAARYKLTPTMESYQDPCWQSASVPCVGTSQVEDAYITDLTWLNSSGWASFQHSQWFPDWGSYRYRTGEAICWPYNDQTSGDSGHPVFMLINGELVLIGPWSTCGGVPWPGQYTDEINTVIADLDNWAYTYHTPSIPRTGYTVTPSDLSAFPSLW